MLSWDAANSSSSHADLMPSIVEVHEWVALSELQRCFFDGEPVFNVRPSGVPGSPRDGTSPQSFGHAAFKTIASLEPEPDTNAVFWDSVETGFGTNGTATTGATYFATLRVPMSLTSPWESDSQADAAAVAEADVAPSSSQVSSLSSEGQVRMGAITSIFTSLSIQQVPMS